MNTPTPSAATDEIADRLEQLGRQMRSTIRDVADPQAKALLETGAEVLGGLRHAFLDYAEGREDAWQR